MCLARVLEISTPPSGLSPLMLPLSFPSPILLSHPQSTLASQSSYSFSLSQELHLIWLSIFGASYRTCHCTNANKPCRRWPTEAGATTSPCQRLPFNPADPACTATTREVPAPSTHDLVLGRVSTDFLLSPSPDLTLQLCLQLLNLETPHSSSTRDPKSRVSFRSFPTQMVLSSL